MDMTAWTALHKSMIGQQAQRPLSKVTLRRIAGFARPLRKQIICFLLLSVVLAGTAVATPVLAGKRSTPSSKASRSERCSPWPG